MDIYDKADQQGQDKVMKFLPMLFSACTITCEQHFHDKSPVDIFVTATTQSGKITTYAIECKDRKCSHNEYQDYMIEEHKYNSIKQFANQGYRPIYLNTFSDDTFYAWNLNKSSIIRKTYTTTKTTVEDNGKIRRDRILLPSSEICCSGSTHP